MKNFYGFVVLLLWLASALLAQEHYTEGPIWRVSLIRVKPTGMDAYLTNLRQSTKPLLEKEKKQGMIMAIRSSSRRPSTIPRTGTSASPSSTRTMPPWMGWPQKAKRS
jgi:hypothetical protein